MNPDPNFVLHGQPPSYWSRPGYLSNSELTTTTKGVGRYSPECYDDRDGKRMTESLRIMSKNLNRVSSSLKQTLLGKDSINYNNSLCTSVTEDELVKLSQPNLEGKTSYDGRPRSREAAQWYTSPPHLSMAQLRPTRSVSPVHRKTGTLGLTLDDQLSSKSRVYREMELKRLANEDILACKYFPVTLGAAYYMQSADSRTGIPEKFSNCRSSLSNVKKSKRARSAARLDEVLQDVQYPPDRQDVLLLSTEAPTIASSVMAVRITPYQANIARLRMERLRIEEDRLLELKRQEELERIRGPKPKWYEMKTPEFHYEAHKNNQLIRSRDKWDDLLEYRQDLVTASNDFNQSWDTHLMA